METQTQQQKTTNGAPPVAAPQTSAMEVHRAPGEIVRVGFDTVQGFEALQRIATAFCASSLVPPQYQGKQNLANAVIAVEMAMRMRASPLMVMQNLYIVHNRPAWSSQFLISAFNSCGRFAAIRYRFTGEKGRDTWGCIAFTKELASGELVEGPEVTVSMAKAEGWFGKNGSKWQTIPQLMLTYRAATFLIRTTAPELTMGLRTADEVEDIGEQTEVFAPPPALEVLPVQEQATPAAAAASPASDLQAAQEALRAAAGEA